MTYPLFVKKRSNKATEITQNANEMGNGLKTTSLRIRGLNEETSEADESLKGMNETLYSLSGVSIFTDDTQQTYRSTYDILRDISKVWESLTDHSRAKILEKIAGKHQANRISAIISNFSSAERALTVQANSAGSALEEQEKRMESIAAHINKFTETLTGFWQNAIDTDIIKLFFDISTKFVNILDVLINSLDGFGGKSVLMGTAFLALKKNVDKHICLCSIVI